MTRPRILRLLRVAVSAVCGIFCLLLIALWVRSYRVHDVVWGWFPFRGYLQVNSTVGDLKLIANAEQQNFKWQHSTREPAVNHRHWHFNLDRESRFGWWLDITVPHWFLASVLMIFTAIPWIPWSNRFSLRTLLVATTLVAVVLGLVVAMR
jgi:hypothetical protein